MENPINTKSFKAEIFDALGLAWRSMKSNFAVLCIAQLCLYFLESPFDRIFQLELPLVGEDGHTSLPMSLAEIAYAFFIYAAIYASSHLLILRSVRGESVSLTILLKGYSCYLNVLLATLLTLGLIAVSLIFLIVPGIYVMCRMVFVAYLVMDEGMGPIEAIEGSWRLTKGHVVKMIALLMVNIPFVIVLVLLMYATTGFENYPLIWTILILPLTVWTKSALAALYLSITQQPQQSIEDVDITVRGALTIIFSVIAALLLIVIVTNFEAF